jgi:glycosyltransferase involved in cell wall biosynthesis
MELGVTAEALIFKGTGLNTYSLNLIEHLSKIPTLSISLIVYDPDSKYSTLKRIIISNPFIKFSRLYLWHPYLTTRLNSKKYPLDIIHSLNAGPSFFKLKNQKYVITIHDLIPLIYPKTRQSMVSMSYKFLFPRTLENADKIIAVSNSTKSDLIKYFNVSAEKIEVIHEAADERFKPLTDDEVRKVKQKYHLDFPFILYVGGLTPYKNLITLVKAFYKLKIEGINHKLVIAGTKRWRYKELFDFIDHLHLQDDIIFTGYVPDEDLPSMYNAAELFIYPSLYEGFGLPPLEAMACGCPVIASNASSIPEVVGDAGILFDPYDVNKLADHIFEVLSDDLLRANLSKKGLDRAKQFTWDRCALETFKVYQKMIDFDHM